ncbi:MAG: hypothetical protein OES32_11060 [Acidobacteriota bacterium]|nr:hypothetical protein [Acidobacteriota bacterium]MDH3524116.1 hypothetical protein [Acidobacteriota bacterium]
MATKTEEQKKNDATTCARQGCKEVGLYKGLDLTPAQFRKLPCRDIVEKLGSSCPLDPAAYPDHLVKFREVVRGCLKKKGYERPVLMLQMLCSEDDLFGEIVPWTWGDWCDHLAARL